VPVTLKSSTIDGPGARGLVDGAIVSDATATYEPELVACTPKAGTYPFNTDFGSH
jgi:hypothetical protein